MLYDVTYRHNEALAPDALITVSAALHAVNAAAIDCRRAGKQVAGDPAFSLLIRNLAAVAERTAPDMACCALPVGPTVWRFSTPLHCLVLPTPKSVAISRPSALSTIRLAELFLRLARKLGFATRDLHVSSDMGRADDEGRTTLHHSSIAIYVIPRGFVPNRQITWNRRKDGCDTGPTHYASLADLMDAGALQCRIATMIAPVSAPRLTLSA